MVRWCAVYAGYGGGWGYSGHSIEAVRFTCDSDVLLGGFALFGGRGEYFGKIRVCCFLNSHFIEI